MKWRESKRVTYDAAQNTAERRRVMMAYMREAYGIRLSWHMRAWLWIRALFLASVFLGCTAEPYVRHGDETFTAGERVEIERGNAWIAAHVGHEPIPIVWDLPHPEGEDVASIPSGIVRRSHPGHADGACFNATGRWEIDLGSIDAGTYAHEMGHWYGLAHTSPEHGGVMRPADLTLVWGPEEQAECERVLGAGGGHVSACVP